MQSIGNCVRSVFRTGEFFRLISKSCKQSKVNHRFRLLAKYFSFIGKKKIKFKVSKSFSTLQKFDSEKGATNQNPKKSSKQIAGKKHSIRLFDRK